MGIRLRTFIEVAIAIFVLSTIASCASLYDGDDKDISVNKEFDKAIKIEAIEPPAPDPGVKKVENSKSKKKPPKKTSAKKTSPKKKTGKSKKASKKNKEKKVEKVEVKKTEAKSVSKKEGARQPKLEDSEGFIGRRPIKDPFRVGEQITLKVSYFAVEAGKFTMGMLPMKQVNGNKSYHFHYKIKSSSLFSLFYAVDDVAETFVDYEKWIPHSYEIHVKESKQVRETRSYFDWKKLRGYMWDKKKVPGRDLEKKKLEWDIFPYSQNVFSVAFYLRTFTLKVGKTLKVRVGHEGKNLIMTAKVLRKEILDTPAGRFEAFVIRPTFEVDGIFKPTGDNLLWVSADDRKFILRIESKIRIGTIVAMIESLKKQ